MKTRCEIIESPTINRKQVYIIKEKLNMKMKYHIIILSLILTMFLSGCTGGGIVTPDINDIGGDAYLCENLLKGYYIALSNQNFA